jgi:trans-2,3-dihydro-3-hydroxyanthranilate isomerase
MIFAMAQDDDQSNWPAHVQGCDIRARVFVPGSTVPEDPATGSANANLAGYLAARTPRDGTLRWQVAQGLEMGRPSRLVIEADKVQGRPHGGACGRATVVISEGTLRVPDRATR